MANDGRESGRGETWVVVPLRGLEVAKSRLGAQLDAEERLDLVTGLLERTLEAATACPDVDRVLLVSPDRATLDLGRRIGAETLLEAGAGLNAALDSAREHALVAGARTLLVLPADLPRVSPEAIGRLITVGERAGEAARPPVDPAAGDRPGQDRPAAEDRPAAGPRPAGEAFPGRRIVVLVPDRHGDGTNALLVSPPDAIPFSFGLGSRATHRAAALASGAAYVEVDGELTLDVDTPDDLLLAEAALSSRELGGGTPTAKLARARRRTPARHA